MEHAIEIQFKGEGQAVFEKIIAIWPPIIRQRRKEKILLILSLLMQARKVKKQTVISLLKQPDWLYRSPMTLFSI